MKFQSVILIFIIFLNLTSSAKEIKNIKFPNCDKNSIWKHAAYQGSKEIFTENIQSAIEQGYCGIELDINYDKKDKIVYISHNPILSSKKKKYSLNLVDDILANKKVYVWLDWKNTNYLFLKEGLEAIKYSLKKYLSSENSLILIETPHVLKNEYLNFLIKNNKNIEVINWLSLSSEKKNLFEKFKNILRNIRAYTYVCILPNKLISSNDTKILQMCKNNQKVKSFFIFTINDKNQAIDIFSEGADVILSDVLK